ncbi:MAG: NFACT RNA binding domain-containing protein [Bacteroidia bacterium]|nr:NFACT RNA binding domain-containing protein [Bacteroidia bacterium]MDW8158689.1 NFACT RNA binding domain-containing protein [Bacteroidia bacterium]
MQHISYIVLFKVAQWLSEHVKGARLIQGFTQQKDEIIFEIENFETQENIFLRVGCSGNFQYVVPQLGFSRARSNTMNLFSEIHGLKIKDVLLLNEERCIVFELESTSYQLAFIMHGNRSNVVLLENQLIIKKFRKNIKTSLATTNITRATEVIDSLETFLLKFKVKEDDLYSSLKKAYPYLDNILVRAILDEYENLGNWYLAYRRVLEKAILDEWYIGINGNKVNFYCLQPSTSNETTIKIEGIVEALNEFIRRWYSTTYFYTLKHTTYEKIVYLENKVDYKITSLKKSIQHLQKERNYDEIANIIMANLHKIPPKITEVELYDFYKNQNIIIHLNPDLTPQQNAANYYQKNKQASEKIKYLEKNFNLQLQEKIKIEQIKQEFNNCKDLKAIKDFHKKYPYLLGEEKEEREIPFRIFQKKGYSIWVGRNAKNNDLLTLHFAKKNDIWLHAKDCAGSHVIIKNTSAQNVPQSVLEYAAGLAAFYSRQKNSSLVPVLYTLRKYIRKNKKMAQGEVAVERAKILLVPPLKPDILEEETENE